MLKCAVCGKDIGPNDLMEVLNEDGDLACGCECKEAMEGLADVIEAMSMEEFANWLGLDMTLKEVQDDELENTVLRNT